MLPPALKAFVPPCNEPGVFLSVTLMSGCRSIVMNPPGHDRDTLGGFSRPWGLHGGLLNSPT